MLSTQVVLAVTRQESRSSSLLCPHEVAIIESEKPSTLGWSILRREFSSLRASQMALTM